MILWGILFWFSKKPSNLVWSEVASVWSEVASSSGFAPPRRFVVEHRARVLATAAAILASACLLAPYEAVHGVQISDATSGHPIIPWGMLWKGATTSD
jgi:hypothetical protein